MHLAPAAPACTQLEFMDLTAMPLSGSVFLAALAGPAGYDDEWNAALGSSRCALADVTVCAYNTFSGDQVRHFLLLLAY